MSIYTYQVTFVDQEPSR